MKILFMSGNLCDGGAQRVISVVTSALAEKGHDVSLLLFSRNEKEYPINDKVKISSMCDSYADYCKTSSMERVRFVRKYLKELKPQAAVGFIEGGYALYLSSSGMRFAKVASARVDPKRLMQAKGLRAMINRMWFRSASAVVMQTKAQVDHVPQGIAKRSIVIANPVSDRALAIKKQDYDTCRRFVMAGRLATQKNYPMVFEAVQRVKQTYPDVHVDIFGQGEEESQLKAMLHEMALEENVTLRGWTEDTVGEYAAHDAYILSSDFEGLPNALMEAMAVGLPCISTDCDTGPADLITDGENGYLIPVNDAAALADRMIKLMDMSAEERKHMGESARHNLSENFNSERITEQWEQLLTRLVK